MDNFNPETITDLILHNLEGSASEEERILLENWIASSDENRKYYQQIKNLWEVSDRKNSEIKIHADAAFDTILRRISDEPQRKGMLFYLQRIAAILIIPLTISGYFAGKNLEKTIKGSSVSYNEIYASWGTRSAIVLSDGSHVWLNSGSKLRYPDKFVSQDRLVYLSGEAYFEVKSDKTRPFIVETKNLRVKATGTSFNVHAPETEPEVKVSLLNGIVSISRNDGRKERALTLLKPNQMYSYNLETDNSHIYSGDLYEFIAWKDGRLVFRNRPLSEVVKIISSYYNVDIELRGKELQDYRYRATFEEESLEEILKLLKMSSPVKYTEVPRVLLPDGSFTKRKIIISPM